MWSLQLCIIKKIYMIDVMVVKTNNYTQIKQLNITYIQA